MACIRVARAMIALAPSSCCFELGLQEIKIALAGAWSLGPLGYLSEGPQRGMA